MIFSSITFIFYFLPVVTLIYYMLAFNRKLQNVWLFAAGIIFYAWGEPVYILLLLASILFNWGMGLWIEKAGSSEGKKGKLPLFVTCFLNIGLIVIGKGTGTLPVGLSFYTFHALSYVVDVYRKDSKAERNLLYFGLYLSFFPKVLAGPMARYSVFGEEIRSRKCTLRKFSVGVCRFTAGMGKKILLAGNLAILANLVFNYSAMGRVSVQVPAVMAWMGLIAFAMQIYFDYSGYSDMAVGLGLMFGFSLDENFNYPYAAVSISDFWRRWNISLVKWFREYLYFPLGGSASENKDKMVKNMLVLWLIIGIWHGFNGTFLLWGLWHFFFQLLERFIGFAENIHRKWLLRIYTLAVTGLGWVLFRAQDLYQAGRFYMNMFACNYNGIWNERTGFLLKEYGIFLLAGGVLCSPVAKKLNSRMVEEENRLWVKISTICYPAAMLALFAAAVSYLIRSGSSAFIYFSF